MKQSDLEFTTGIEYFAWFTISSKIKADLFSEEEENM